MSLIRSLEERRFSKGSSGLYVIITTTSPEKIGVVELVGDGIAIPSEDFIEIMFRVLDQAGVKFALKDLNKARERLGLPKVRKIISVEESGKAYFPPEFWKKKRKSLQDTS